MNEAFKTYKSKTSAPNLSRVIDYNGREDDKLTKIKIHGGVPKIGLISLDQWEVFKIKEKPGLLLIKNPFTSVGQRYWIRKLLQDYTKHPNPNNLRPPRFVGKVIEDFWTCLNEESDEQQRRFIKKSMRWSTLGYHYDWNNKVYDESSKNEFPPELSLLVSSFAKALGFKGYKSEAAIVNFYPTGSTLSAHTDHSEFFLESPLFSISFGQSAIFLIGGNKREDDALPILLNSGDVLVMSADSRLCYHAVPRVFTSDRQPWNSNEDVTRCSDLIKADVDACLKTEEWKPFENYLKDSRINVNVRQVNK